MQIVVAESDQVRAVYEAWERDFKSSSNIHSSVACSDHSPVSPIPDEEDELEQIDLEYNSNQNGNDDILCRGNKLKVMENTCRIIVVDTF